MLDEKYFANGHLTPKAFAALNEGVLTADDRELFLTHLLNCDECIAVWMDALAESPLAEPPGGMESRVLAAVSEERGKRKKARIIAIQWTKLAVAVCLTTVFLTAGVFQFLGDRPSQRIQNNAAQQIEAEKEKENSDAPKEPALSFDQIVGNINSGFRQIADFMNYGMRNIGDGNNERK